jgi:uncharacterized protein (TIGR00725 family)
MSDVEPRWIVGVMGPGEGASPAECETAYALGEAIATAGWVLLTGGRRAGVMDAASRGAKAAGGWVIGILPEGDRRNASPSLDLAIPTGLGSARNAVNVLASSVVIACGMGLGTASEVALALKSDRPVICLHCSPVARAFWAELGGDRCQFAHSVSEAIALAWMLHEDFGESSRLERGRDAARRGCVPTRSVGTIE